MKIKFKLVFLDVLKLYLLFLKKMVGCKILLLVNLWVSIWFLVLGLLKILLLNSLVKFFLVKIFCSLFWFLLEIIS